MIDSFLPPPFRPTKKPTARKTLAPTATPTKAPTAASTAVPTDAPVPITHDPTDAPVPFTDAPTGAPAADTPTGAPTNGDGQKVASMWQQCGESPLLAVLFVCLAAACHNLPSCEGTTMAQAG